MAVNGEPVSSSDELSTQLEKLSVGDTVTLTLVRGDTRVKLSVKLQAV